MCEMKFDQPVLRIQPCCGIYGCTFRKTSKMPVKTTHKTKYCLYNKWNIVSNGWLIFEHTIPDKLTESLVVSKRSVVLFSKDMIDVLHAPGIQQLGGGLRLLKFCEIKCMIIFTDLALTMSLLLVWPGPRAFHKPAVPCKSLGTPGHNLC